MKILIQFPEGLKPKAMQLASKYRTEGEVYLSGSRCFGGCDIAFNEATMIGADKIIHFGHARFPIPDEIRKKYKDIEVEYVEYSIEIDEKFLDRVVEYLKNHRIKEVVVVTTVQHIHQIQKIKEKFSEDGISVILGKGGRTVYPGQILGCDAGAAFAAPARTVLYIGGGRFHYLAIRRGLDVPDRRVIAADPFNRTVKDVTDEINRYVKARRGLVVKASEGNVFGIIVSTKPGQFNIRLAEEVKRKLDEKGKDSHILVSDTVDWEALQDYSYIDAFINTACPRIADDWRSVNKPIINTDELELLFQLMKR